MKKYLLIGDYVSSKTNSDIHYISANSLIKLYDLDPSECYLIDYKDRDSLQGIDESKFIVLTPRYEGDYKRHLYTLKEK
jgi:hypothetical protein